MKTTFALVALLGAAAVATLALAQPPGGPGRDRGPRGDGPPHGPPPPPVMEALDADRDGTLSAEEISGASEALKTLDKNDDGKLTEDELRPPRPPQGDRPGRGPGGPGGFGPPQDGPRGEGAGGEGRRGRRQRGGREEGRFDGPPGGPRGDGPPPGDGPQGGLPPIVPPPVRAALELSDEQSDKLAQLHEEVQTKLKSILTEAQYEKLSHIRPPHPQGPPGGFGDRRPPRDE